MILGGFSLSVLNAYLQGDSGFFDFFATAFGLVCIAAFLFFIGLMIAGLWLVFEKADQKGWKAIIPIYNVWVLLEIVGRPQWWIILFFVPVVDIIIWIIVMLDLAKSFDKNIWWAVGLILLPWLTILFLGFGDALYYEPAGAR